MTTPQLDTAIEPTSVTNWVYYRCVWLLIRETDVTYEVQWKKTSTDSFHVKLCSPACCCGHSVLVFCLVGVSYSPASRLLFSLMSLLYLTWLTPVAMVGNQQLRLLCIQTRPWICNSNGFSASSHLIQPDPGFLPPARPGHFSPPSLVMASIPMQTECGFNFPTVQLRLYSPIDMSTVLLQWLLQSTRTHWYPTYPEQNDFMVKLIHKEVQDRCTNSKELKHFCMFFYCHHIDFRQK